MFILNNQISNISEMERGEHLLKDIPVLASLNIKKTVQFNKDKLGFDRVGYLDHDYAIIARDYFIVHFWKCNNKIHPENTSCYLDVKDIDILYEELKRQNVIHPNGKLEDKEYGTREFAVLDEDGNLIKFSERIE